MVRETVSLKLDIGMSNGIIKDCNYSGNGRKGEVYLFWANFLQVFIQSYSRNYVDAIVDENGVR